MTVSESNGGAEWIIQAHRSVGVTAAEVGPKADARPTVVIIGSDNDLALNPKLLINPDYSPPSVSRKPPCLMRLI